MSPLRNNPSKTDSNQNTPENKLLQLPKELAPFRNTIAAFLLANAGTVNGATTVIDVPHDTSSILNAYNNIGNLQNYVIIVTGDTAASISSVSGIEFRRNSTFTYPGLPENTIDEVDITNGSGIHQGSFQNLGISGTNIEDATTNTPIETNQQVFEIHLSFDPNHEIDQALVALGESNPDISYYGVDSNGNIVSVPEIAFSITGDPIPEPEIPLKLSLAGITLLMRRRR